MVDPGEPRPLYVAEPPPLWRRLPPAVVDASVVCATTFGEPESARALELCTRHALAAPDLLPYEVTNAAAGKVRRGQRGEDARQALAAFLALDIALHRTDALARFDLALRYNLSAYDAAYLWLAGELHAPLLTFDVKLAEAATDYLRQPPPASVSRPC